MQTDSERKLIGWLRAVMAVFILAFAGFVWERTRSVTTVVVLIVAVLLVVVYKAAVRRNFRE
jgi:hypothetical protein